MSRSFPSYFLSNITNPKVACSQIIDCPQGLEDAKKDKCVKLLHTIYGLVQSARQFWKKLVNDLKNTGFKVVYPDPCLMWRENDFGMIFIALYVDDCLCIGDKDAIAILEKEFVNVVFQVKPSEELNYYLSWNIDINKEEGSAILHQGHLIKKLNKLYGKQVKGLTAYKMLGTPSVGLVRPTEKKKVVYKEYN